MLGMVDFSLIPVFIIDEMTLKHGSASISEESGALGGSIQINNKPNWNNSFRAKYYQGIGSFKTFNEYLLLSFGNKKIQSKSRFYHTYSKNDYPFLNKAQDENDKGVNFIKYKRDRNKNAAFGKYGFTQEIYARLKGNYLISSKIWGQKAYRSLPTASSYEGDKIKTEGEKDSNSQEKKSPTNKQDDNTIKFTLDAKKYGDKFNITARTAIDYQELNYIQQNHIKKNKKEETYTAVYSKSKMRSWYNYIEAEYKPHKNLSVLLNANYNRSKISTSDTTSKTGYEVKRNHYKLFSGIYWQANNFLQLSLMLRNEIIEKDISPLIFNMGLSYKPLITRDLLLKASVARNYHSPNLNDLYWQPGGNPDLKEEKGITVETGLFYKTEIGKKTELETQLTAYRSEITNWILWLPTFKGYWEPVNVKKVNATGLELGLKLKREANFKWHLTGTYGLTKSINCGEKISEYDNSKNKQLPFIPVHSANFTLSVEHKGFYLRFSNNTYGERYIMSSNEETTGDDSDFFDLKNDSKILYAHFMNNISAGKIFPFRRINIELNFKINNLFDEEYRSILNKMMPERNYTLMLKFDFKK